MPFRIRKSKQIAPGVRLTAGKKSGSISVGGRGARYSASSSGRRTTTVGLPGTGVSNISTTSGGQGRRQPGAGGEPFTIVLQKWFWIVAGIAAMFAYAYLGGWLGVGLVAAAVVGVFVYERQRLSAGPAEPQEPTETDR